MKMEMNIIFFCNYIYGIWESQIKTKMKLKGRYNSTIIIQQFLTFGTGSRLQIPVSQAHCIPYS